MSRILQLLSVMVVCPLCVGSVLAQADKEPTYQGRTAGDWIKLLETSTSDFQRSSAVLALGKIGPATKEVLPALVKALDDRAVSVRYNAVTAIKSMELSPKEAVPVFLKASQSKDEIVRATAVAALGDIGLETKEVLPVLMKALDDQSSSVRGNAVRAIKEVELSTEDTIALFVKAMKTNGGTIMHDIAFAALARLGPEGKQAVPAMLKIVVDPAIFIDTRDRVFRALGEMGPGAKEAVPGLILIVRGRDTRLRGPAVTTLGKIGPDAKDAVPDLLVVSEGKDYQTSIGALVSLGQIGSATPEVIAAIIKALGHEKPEVGELAAGILKKFGAPAVPALIEAFNKQPKQRLLIARTLGEIGAPSKEAVPVLSAALVDENHVHRRLLAAALAQIGPAARDAGPALSKLAGDQVAEVRTEATAALAKIAPGPEVLPALRDALKDVELGVRANAALAMGEIKPASKEAVPLLIAVLMEIPPRPIRGGRPDPNVALIRTNAVASLSKIGSPAVPALLQVFREKTAAGRPLTFAHALVAKALGGMGPEAVPALRDALKDENPVVRANALAALRHMGKQAKEAVPGFIEAARDKEHHSVRIQAVQSLEVFCPDNKDALAAVVKALGDESSMVQHAAVQVLAKVGPEAKAAVPAMLKLLEGDKTEQYLVRREIVPTLGNIGPGAKEAIPALCKVMAEDRDIHIRRAASVSLLKVGPTAEALPSVLKTFKERDPVLRGNAALALGEIGAPAKDAVPALIEAVGESDGGVGVQAVAALGKLGPLAKDAIPALIDVLTGTKKAPFALNPKQGEDVALALAKIGPAAVPALMDVLRDRNRGGGFTANSHEMAALALSRMGAGAIPALRDGLKDENATIRTYCAAALGQMTPPAKEVIPALIDALDDRMPIVRSKAATALGNFGADAKAATPGLVKMLKERNPDLNAAATLGRIGPAAAESVPALKTLLRGNLPAAGRATVEDALKKIRAKGM